MNGMSRPRVRGLKTELQKLLVTRLSKERWLTLKFTNFVGPKEFFSCARGGSQGLFKHVECVVYITSKLNRPNGQYLR